MSAEVPEEVFVAAVREAVSVIDADSHAYNLLVLEGGINLDRFRAALQVAYEAGRKSVGEWLADEVAYEIHWHGDTDDDRLISYYGPGESERALAWAQRVVEDVDDLWVRAEVLKVLRSTYRVDSSPLATFSRKTGEAE